jgi:hypothetical protein
MQVSRSGKMMMDEGMTFVDEASLYRPCRTGFVVLFWFEDWENGGNLCCCLFFVLMTGQ